MIGRIGRIGEVEHSENCYTKVLRAHLDSTRISDSYPLRSKRSSFSFLERGLLRDDAQNFSRFRPERTFVVVEQSSKAFKACTAYIEAKQRVSHHLIAAMASTEDIRNFEAFSFPLVSRVSPSNLNLACKSQSKIREQVKDADNIVLYSRF